MKYPLASRACCSVFLLLAVWGVRLAQAQSNSPLEQVLDGMDKAKDNFRTIEAGFVWDEYNNVVKETDTEKGKIYFRRVGNELQMAVEVADPPKYVLLTGSKLQLYLPKADQVTVYNMEKNQSEFESFLKLGFGGGGHSLLKSFDVSYVGTENLNGVNTAKLDLVPKNPKALNMFPHIVLWIDPGRGVSVRQQLFQRNGDYRLADYSDIRLNQKISDGVFKLKTNGKTTFQTVSPRD